jgi:predicted RecB family nuclease
MQRCEGALWLSPTDLSAHLECAHTTTLALEVAEGLRAKPSTVTAYTEMIFAKGNEHERDYREQLVGDGRTVVEIEFDRADWAAGAARTEGLMRAGADVIYQAPFAFSGWRGVADFLVRIETPSALGAYSYEAVDTKLARTAALPHHALQLVFYAAGIARVQGVWPTHAHVQLGSGRRESIRLREIGAYANYARRGMETAIRRKAVTEPVPCGHCDFCAFKPTCAQVWEDADHLTRVAGIRSDHIALLAGAGVTTLTQLATLPPATPVAGIRTAALAAVTQQARLQREAVAGERPPYELLPHEDGRGFALLPEPSAGDVMFDFEGDPFWTPAQGLMFLVGLLVRAGDGWRYEAIWAHDRAGEKLAFERLVDLLVARLAEHPDMHVYHYSAAETSEIKRLMAEHGTREVEVDSLLRRRVFVDLLTVTRQSLRAGVRSYSLKQTELLAGFERSAAMGSGADAVLGYERWRTSGHQDELDGIAAYNEEDCLATLALRDWLLAVRPAGITGPSPVPVAEIAEESLEAASEREHVRAALTAGQEPGSSRWLAGELLEYHAREARPAYWRWYELQAMDEDELLDDREALAGLEPAGDPVDDGQSQEFVLRYPAQVHKVEPGDWCDHRTGRVVHVEELDDGACTLVVRRGKKLAGDPPPRALVPTKPYNTRVQRAALLRLAVAVRDGDPRYRALRDVLSREAPRLSGMAAGAELQTIALARQRVLARSLDKSTLVVQGPPGTGKTWLGARLIVDLLAHGKRVGITAMSHNAINNLLDEVERAAASDGVLFRGARNATGGWTPPDAAQIEILSGTGATARCFDPAYALVAGTTWTFAPECADGQLDYLVIDEAGQLSLADSLAAGTSARNLILLGDPLQLAHVSQAVHPVGTSLSVLQHLLGEHATIPGDRGVFLEETRRMHPAVCEFISEEVYEGRLRSHPDCSRQSVGGTAGIRHLSVAHLGNSSTSPEEARAIRLELELLLTQAYRMPDGRERPLTPRDCMVVTPYNAQVRVLSDALPAGVRIGTVDRFQGQEAPVVFYSMATSSGDDAPRDARFLFSRNRLNVAVSRARCLAYLVCAPALLETRAKTLEQMRLISTLCSLADAAAAVPGAAAA